MRLTLRPTSMLALGALTVGSIGLVSAAAMPAVADEGGTDECVPGLTTLSSVDFEDGSMGEWEQNGDPVLEIVDLDTQVLQVSERFRDYEGVSFASAELEAGVEYTFSARARLADGVADRQIRFVATDDATTWDWVGTSAVTADGWTEFSGTYTFPADNVDNWKVFLSTTNVGGLEEEEHIFFVDDLQVTFNEDCGDGGAEEPGVCTPDLVTHTSIDFEDETTGTWIANDATTLEFVDGAAAPNTSRVLAVSDRGDFHFGLQSAEGDFEEGVEYTFSADVLLPEDAVARFVAYDEDTDNTYNWLAQNDVVAGEWTTVTGSYTFQPGAIASAKVYIQVHIGVR